MMTIPTLVGRHGRVVALGLLLALGGCGGTPPSATRTAGRATTTAPGPATIEATPPVPVVAAPATATPAATRAVAPPATATRAAMAGTPAATVAATATRGAPAPTATAVAPTTTPAPTPRGYAPGDPCAPYAAGAVPPPGRAAAAAPARLCIPALALSAPVVPVGATPAGAMAEAPDPWAVGWYAPGPPPGARGNAALAGAVDARGVGPAVFWELDRLRPGDTLIVVDQAGVARRFVVLENAVYRREGAPLTRVFGTAADANLALITGAGTWDPALGVYDSNRVVFARMQP